MLVFFRINYLAKSDFIIKKGLQNEFEQFLGSKIYELRNKGTTLEQYSKEVFKKNINNS